MRKIIPLTLIMIVAGYFYFEKKIEKESPQTSFSHKVSNLPIQRVDQTRVPSSLKKEEAPLELGSPKEKRSEDKIHDYTELPGLPQGYALSTLSGPPMAVKIPQGQAFPISTVIKLTDISDAERRKLTALGFSEHYYHPELKILYVEATLETVISTHKELLKEGYASQLEVQRHFHKPK